VGSNPIIRSSRSSRKSTGAVVGAVNGAIRVARFVFSVAARDVPGSPRLDLVRSAVEGAST
jgi:hypothetical protein